MFVVISDKSRMNDMKFTQSRMITPDEISLQWDLSSRSCLRSVQFLDVAMLPDLGDCELATESSCAKF